MTTSGPDFYHDELEPEHIAALLEARALTANEVVEGLWSGTALVRRNAARGSRFVANLPDPGEAMLRIASKDPDEGVRAAVVAAVAAGIGSLPVAMPILFDAVLDGGDGIRDTALQGLETRLVRDTAGALPYFLGALSDLRSAVAAVANQLLIKVGGQAAAIALIPLLGHGDPRKRRAAYDVLDRLKWQAIGPLVDALTDPSARPLVAKLLGGLGEVDDESRAKLLAYVDPTSEWVNDAGLVDAATRVLGELGRVVSAPRTAPLNIPIAGFTQRRLDEAELMATDLGAVALDELFYGLRDGRDVVRSNAALTLGLHPGALIDDAALASIINALTPVVRDASAEVREATVTTLGRLTGSGASSAVKLLARSLDDQAARVRQSAVDALIQHGTAGLVTTLGALEVGMKPTTFSGLRDVASRLSESAPSSPAVVVEALADAISGGELGALGRELACVLLGDFGPAAEPSLPGLLNLLRDPMEDVRAAAATALGFVGLEDPVIIDGLKRLLGDTVPTVRRAAALAASRITGRPLDDRSAKEPQPIPIEGFETALIEREALVGHGVSAETLVPALRDGREIVKINAARAIGALGESGQAAAQPLAMLLRDTSAEVRRAAVQAFADLGKAGLPGAWFLTAALTDPEADVRDGVIDVLVALFPEAADFLVEALRNDTGSARLGIFNVWYRLARHGVPTLGAALKNPSGLIRLNAALALEMLAQRGADEALDQLELRLADPIGQVRVAAQAAIDAIKGGKPRPPRVLEPDPVAIAGFDRHVVDPALLEEARGATTPERMVRALRDGRAFVRENAVAVLGAYAAHGEAAPGLVVPALAVAMRDGTMGVRKAAARALGRVGTREVGPVLVHALEDRHEEVREAARAGLLGLGVTALPALTEGLLRLGSLAGLPAGEAFKRSVLPLFARLADTTDEAAVVSALGSALAGGVAPMKAGALAALRHIGRERAERLRDAVITLEADGDAAVVREAKATRAHLDGKDVEPAAAPALPLPEPMVERVLSFEELEGVLAEAGGLEINLVLKATQDGREVVRQNAARTIGLVEDPPKRAAMALAILLRDADADVRRAAAETLARCGPAFSAPVGFWLTVALQDPDALIRDTVINVLASVHEVSPEALIEGLRVDPDDAHDTILLVVDRLGPSAVPTLELALNNPSGLVRMNAAQGLELLSKRGADAAVEALEGKQADPIGQVRRYAQAALDAIRGGKPKPPRVLEPDPIAIEGFSEKLLDEDLLAASAGVIAVERLVRALNDGRAWVRGNAATLLGLDADQAEVGPLAVLTRDGVAVVRARAMTALGRMAPRLAEATFEVALSVLGAGLTDKHEAVRSAAQTALEGLAVRALPALVDALALVSGPSPLLASVVGLAHGIGDQSVTALVDALGPERPELHLGALLALRSLASRERLEPHKALVEALARGEVGLGAPAVREAGLALLDLIEGRDLAPAALEPMPLPLPGFADGLLSRELLAESAGELRLDLLTHALNDGRDLVRANAVTGLEVLGSAQQVALPMLVRALRDPFAEVRVRAAEALGAMPPRRDIAFELVNALGDASPRVVSASERALAAYGEFALDAFMYALDDAPTIVGRSVLPMLAQLGDKALDAVVLAQRYDSPLVRRNALTALRLMERESVRAVRPMVALARKDEEREVRLEALRVLEWIDGVEHLLVKEPRPLPTPRFATEPVPREELASLLESYDAALLEELLIDGRRFVRENACAAFGVLGRYHHWLPIRLKDDTVEVQVAAATTLLALGDLALPAANALIEALSEDDDELRALAREALEGLGSRALGPLIEALWAPGDIVRRTVLPILEKLGAEATPAIIEALDHPSQLVTLNALNVLARLYGKDPEGAVKGMAKVVALTRHTLPAIIGAAQKCLFRLEGRTPAEFQKDPVPMPIPGFDKGPLADEILRANAPALDTAWLISALADGRPVVRENAARAAGFMPAVVKDLLGPLTIALKDGVPEVQVAAADAFASLVSEDATAIPALTFALRNATDRVKRACMVALDAYGPERVARELVRHLVGREDWMLVTIGRVAARMSEVMVPALVKVARDPEVSLVARENAVKIIGDLSARARGVEDELLHLLPEMEGMLAAKAAFAIGRVARPNKELVDKMLKHLATDPRPSLHKEVRDAVKVIKRRMPVGA